MKVKFIPISRIFFWYAEGFRLFRKHAGVWMGIMIISLVVFIIFDMAFMIINRYLAMSLGVEFAPILFPMLELLPLGFVLVLLPQLMGGLFLGCNDLEQGQPLKINHLYAGIRQSGYPLLKLGFLSIGIYGLIIIIVGTFIMLGFEILVNILGSQSASSESFKFGLFAIIFPLIIFAVNTVTWFATGLVALKKWEARDAMNAGLSGFFNSFVALLLYGFVSIIIIALAMLPVGLLITGLRLTLYNILPSSPMFYVWIQNCLNWVMLMPTFIASIYVGYREIFEYESI